GPQRHRTSVAWITPQHQAGSVAYLWCVVQRFPKALVHIVADAVYLVSPGVFQRYAQEHPQIADYAKREEMADWQWAQKRFEKLHLHRKQANGLNIWTCEVTGPRKSRRLHGYLLERWQGVFGELPPNNPYLSILS
ncbi:conjugal transfer nickase/helicase domain-containing protein, partial [Xanthomonas euvesicatoria]